MRLNHMKIYLFTLLIFATITLKAQNIWVGVGTGGATFGMNSMKEFNKEIVDLMPFKPVVTDNFPPYFFYKAEVIYLFPKALAVGINFTTTSTGSRLSLADYSGKYTLDNIQKGLFPGIKILIGGMPGKLDGIKFSLEGGVAFSTMNTHEEIKVFEQSQTDNKVFKAQGFFIQPGICYFVNIIPRVKVCANLSYYIGFEKGYHLPKEKDQILFNTETEKPVKPQWDGIRLGLTAYWSFQNKLK